MAYSQPRHYTRTNRQCRQKPPRVRKAFQTSPEKIEVRQSGVHGKGVYAVAAIRKGERIVEYTGEHMSWDEAMDLPPRDPDDPYHTFFFSLDNGDVIDASRGGTTRAGSIIRAIRTAKRTRKRTAFSFTRCAASRPVKSCSTTTRSCRRSDGRRSWRRSSRVCAEAANCRGTMLEPVKAKKKKR
jgi:hypothetical protein